MALIDRYLIRQYLRVFLMTFISLLGIYVVADFVTNYSDFARLESDGGMGRAMATYYGARVPLFFEMCGRIVAVLAAVFVVSMLQGHNELTALMAAGVSRWRVVQPLVLVAAVTACLGVANRELVLPAVRDELSQDIKDVVHHRPLALIGRFDDETDILFDGESLVLSESLIRQPRLTLPAYWDGIGQKLRGTSAVRRAAKDGMPAGYLIQGISAAKIDDATSFQYAGRELVWTRANHAWLQPQEVFVISSLELEDLREGGGSGQYSTTAQLMRGLRTGKLQYEADSQVTLHARFVQPMLDMTLLFLGLPLALAAQQRHVFLAASKCIGMVMLFAAVVLVFHGLGIQNMIRPSLAAWGPLMALVPLAAAISAPLRQ
jgi:lipopolysaccharide export system permease protein